MYFPLWRNFVNRSCSISMKYYWKKNNNNNNNNWQVLWDQVMPETFSSHFCFYFSNFRLTWDLVQCHLHWKANHIIDEKRLEYSLHVSGEKKYVTFIRRCLLKTNPFLGQPLFLSIVKLFSLNGFFLYFSWLSSWLLLLKCLSQIILIRDYFTNNNKKSLV
jgi:hypothetical protein